MDRKLQVKGLAVSLIFLGGFGSWTLWNVLPVLNTKLFSEAMRIMGFEVLCGGMLTLFFAVCFVYFCSSLFYREVGVMNCSDCGDEIEVGEKYLLKGNGETVHEDEFYELGEAYLNKYDDWSVHTREK